MISQILYFFYMLIISAVTSIFLPLFSINIHIIPYIFISILFAIFINSRIKSLREKNKRKTPDRIFAESLVFGVPIFYLLCIKIDSEKLVFAQAINNKGNKVETVSQILEVKHKYFSLKNEILVSAKENINNKVRTILLIIDKNDLEKLHLKQTDNE